MTTYTKQEYIRTLREALRVIGRDQLEGPDEGSHGDAFDIGQSFLVEFDGPAVYLYQYIYYPGNREDPPETDTVFMAKLPFPTTPPDAMAEYFGTLIAHLLIKEQIMSYGEYQFEQELRTMNPIEP